MARSATAPATTLGLKALVAAILGGIGSIPGAFLGGLLIGVFEAAWSAFLPIDYRDVAVFSLLAIVLALRPGGILNIGAARRAADRPAALESAFRPPTSGRRRLREPSPCRIFLA